MHVLLFYFSNYLILASVLFTTLKHMYTWTPLTLSIFHYIWIFNFSSFQVYVLFEHLYGLRVTLRSLIIGEPPYVKYKPSFTFSSINPPASTITISPNDLRCILYHVLMSHVVESISGRSTLFYWSVCSRNASTSL